MEYYKETICKLDDKSVPDKNCLNNEECSTNESLLKNTYFFKKYSNKNLFKNSYNYDIAFLSENISEWDDM